MTDHVARWREDHRNFTRLLDFLGTQVDLIRKAESPNYDLMVDVVHYLTQYSDLFHHPKEDLIFAKLKQRDGHTGTVVDDLAREHAALRKTGEKLLENLEGIVNGDVVLTREAVEADGRAYIDKLRRHMQREETELFVAAATVLSDRDWAAINAALPDPEDPLFGKTVKRHYSALHRQLAHDVDSEARA